MLIGYDAKRLFHNDTGLGYYSRTLIQSFQEEYPDFRAHLYDAYPIKSDLTHPFFNNPRINIIHTGFPSWYYRSFNLNKYIKGSGIQLFHGLSNELPYTPLPSKVPAIVTIHDVLFKTFATDFPWHDRWIYEWKTKIALDRADQVIAISEATKQDLLKYYEISEDKVRVIYQTYDPIFDQKVSEKEWNGLLNLRHLPAEYLLYVGSVTPRKNLMVIIQALSYMTPNERIPLLVLGKGPYYQKHIENYLRSNRLEKWVYFLPDLPRKEIRILYEGAQILIYPSLGEGFGLPVLEGIAANVPVITSNLSALPEAGGEVAQYFNPREPEELKVLILNTNKLDFNKQMSDRRANHLLRFNRSAIARIYLDEVYGRLKG